MSLSASSAERTTLLICHLRPVEANVRTKNCAWRFGQNWCCCFDKAIARLTWGELRANELAGRKRSVIDGVIEDIMYDRGQEREIGRRGARMIVALWRSSARAAAVVGCQCFGNGALAGDHSSAHSELRSDLVPLPFRRKKQRTILTINTRTIPSNHFIELYTSTVIASIVVATDLIDA